MTIRIKSKSLMQKQDDQCWKVSEWTDWNNDEGNDPQVTIHLICEVDKEIDLDIIEVVEGYGVVRIEDSNNNEIIYQNEDFYVVVQNLIEIIMCEYEHLSDHQVNEIVWCIAWNEHQALIKFKEAINKCQD